MELKLLTLMRPLLFPGKFRRGFSVGESNTRRDHLPCISDKKSTVRSEFLVTALFAFQIFLKQEILFID